MDATTIRDPMGGANQSGLRDHNERLVLSLIQRHGGLPSAEIARRANLSAQTVSIIIRELEKDGLLARGEPIRGKVGKPSIPMTLRPDGALSVGLNIGRKSIDLVLIDMTGKIRAQIKRTYAYPTPFALTAFLEENFGRILHNLAPGDRRRIAGIGVAEPFELWNWLDVVNAPKEEMGRWRDFDVAAAVAGITGLPVTIKNDATAACTAEHVFGRGREFADYAYFFIGSFIGGGVVLNDTVYAGRTGNAGAFGSIPVATETGAQQLIHHASLYLLEMRLERAGIDPALIWAPDTDWSAFGAPLEDWLDHTARHLALAAVAVSSVIDFEAVLIDANCPDPVRRLIVERTRAALRTIDTQGIGEPAIAEAAIGRNARAIGAAALPIIERYLLAQPLFG
ncbi:ROK family transcriptional regulator [Albidovulum sp.]|uniref:ROK family transcriptional regulator n=1 Tax=Albidovulum sp. TaxID=1872424 RepID=UPI002CF41076|nr:ROK family transcriptional regulator [Defluviimonas sp.]MCP5324521.1 ROK family transcriptional regulator [Paracoccaceae bacterium]MCP5355311.1 ROK family transcriptional regulator [Paracoccaceae bacterium]HPE24461.1 ROK family transcriptional regulator [Albidovulum sp.]